MKFILLALCLSACATERDYQVISKQIGDYGLVRFDDKAKSVSCYWASDKDNIALSCVKTKNKD